MQKLTFKRKEGVIDMTRRSSCFSLLVLCLICRESHQYADDGYHIGLDGYLYKLHFTPKSWDSARQVCRTEGGYLAMVKSLSTHEYIISQWPLQDFWIGVNDINDEGVYLFDDGSPVETSYWSKDEPNNAEGPEGADEDCAHYNLNWGTGWNDLNCARTKMFLCQKSMADDEAPLPQCVSSREEEHLKGSTFRLMKEKLEFLAAKRRCGEWGGSLASLNTIAKVEFVRKMIPEDDWIWVGGRCLGCSLVEEDDWKWESGDKIAINGSLWLDYDGRRMPWDGVGPNGLHDAMYAQFFCKDQVCGIGNFGQSWKKFFICEK